jgi:two-component system, cell cycle response regulator
MKILPAEDEQVSRRLLDAALRKWGYDFVGRYGGEGFIICLTGVDCLRAAAFAERVCRKIQDTVVTIPDSSGSLQITVSLGLSCSRGDSGKNVSTLIRRADDAVYRAKREGRNRICVASGD